ncbi:MAG: hypothetical protein R3D25_21275 [Geminicoccaceae bacterium]
MDQYIDYVPGHDFGIGIDTVTGSIMGDAIIRTPPEEVTNADGQNSALMVEQVESTEQLAKALSASAEAHARYGLFGASAQFDFARNFVVNSYSIYLLVSSVALNSFRQLRDVRLTKEGVDLWSAGKPDLWRSSKGDAFCCGIQTGGDLHIVLQIETEGTEEQSEISAELNASHGIGIQGFDVAAQFSNTVQHIAQKKALKLRHIQNGGFIEENGLTPEKMIMTGFNFPKSVAGNHAVPFSIMCKDYQTCSNLPPVPNHFDLMLQKDVTNECGRLRLDYLDWIHDIDFILNHPDQFVWSNEREQSRKLGAKADELRQAITLLAKQAAHCADNASHCEMPSGDATVILDLEDIPERRRHKTTKQAGKPTKPPRFPFFSLNPIPGMNGHFVTINGRMLWQATGLQRPNVPKPGRTIVAQGAKGQPSRVAHGANAFAVATSHFLAV